MLGFNYVRPSISVREMHGPPGSQAVVATTSHPAAHLNLATHGFRFFGADFPHHPRPSSRIAKRVDQCFDHLGTIFRPALRKEGVLNRTPERETFNPLSRPVG